MMRNIDIVLEELTKSRDGVDLVTSELWTAFEYATPLGKLAISKVRASACQLLSDLVELAAAAECEKESTDAANA